jgi:hypothetical protein
MSLKVHIKKINDTSDITKNLEKLLMMKNIQFKNPLITYFFINEIKEK